MTIVSFFFGDTAGHKGNIHKGDDLKECHVFCECTEKPFLQVDLLLTEVINLQPHVLPFSSTISPDVCHKMLQMLH